MGADPQPNAANSIEQAAPSSQPAAPGEGSTSPAPALGAGEAEAIFAGGCFWCMEGPFEALSGVLSATSGYTGGKVPGASYEQVSNGGTGHFEAIRVVYDPARVSYAQLLQVFLHNVDPTQDDGQFCDHGSQYLSAVFVHDAAQRKLARETLDAAQKELKRKVVTPVLEQSTFYVAEAYHQDFYRTHSEHYHSYRTGCGRDARLQQLWGNRAAH